MKYKLIVLFGLVCLFSINLISAAPISACGSVGAGSWELDRDLLGVVGTCFSLSSDNVVLDLNGHTVEGNGLGRGVDTSNRENATIKNGTLKNFYYGIDVDDDYTNIKDILIEDSNYGVYVNADYNTLTNVTVRNSNMGFYLRSGTERNELISIKAIDNSVYGIKLYGTQNVTLKNSNMSGNGRNFVMNRGSQIGHIIENNIVDYSYKIYYNKSISDFTYDSTTTPDAGMIVCFDCNNINVRDLDLSHYNSWGAFFYNSTNIEIDSSSMNYNDDGILIQLGENTTLTNINTDYNEAWWGAIGIYNSKNNVLDNISSHYNEGFGIFMDDVFNNDLTNIIANDNGYDGIWIEYHDNTTLTNITTNNNMNGLVVGGNTGGLQLDMQNIQANNNDYDGIWINGWVEDKYINVFNVVANDNGYSGIDMHDYELINFINFTLKRNEQLGGYGGLSIDSSLTNSTIKNIFVEDDKVLGVNFYSRGFNVTVDNITVINTGGTWDWVGINIRDFDNSSFSNLNIINNIGDGLYAYRSDNNLFTNINSSYNTESGIYLRDSDNNIFTNVNSNHNGIQGLFTTDLSAGNSFIDNAFCYNSVPDVNCSLVQQLFTNNFCDSGGVSCGGVCLSCSLSASTTVSWRNMEGVEIGYANLGDTVKMVMTNSLSGTFEIYDEDPVSRDEIKSVEGVSIDGDLVGIWTITQEDLDLADDILEDFSEFYFVVNGNESLYLDINGTYDDSPMNITIVSPLCGENFDEGTEIEINVSALDDDDFLEGNVSINGVVVESFINGGIVFNHLFSSDGNYQIIVEAVNTRGKRARHIANIMIIDLGKDSNYVAACIAEPKDFTDIPNYIVPFDASTTRGIEVVGGFKTIFTPEANPTSFSWYWKFFMPDVKIRDPFVKSNDTEAYKFTVEFPVAGQNSASLRVEFE